MQLNAIIGISTTVFIILLLVVMKMTRFCKKLKHIVRSNGVEEQKSDEQSKETEFTVSVEYDLWGDSPNIKTVSGLISTFVRSKSKQSRPVDLRTVASYRHSLRRFQKQHEAYVLANTLPTYQEATKPEDFRPPNYSNPEDCPGPSSESFV